MGNEARQHTGRWLNNELKTRISRSGDENGRWRNSGTESRYRNSPQSTRHFTTTSIKNDTITTARPSSLNDRSRYQSGVRRVPSKNTGKVFSSPNVISSDNPNTDLIQNAIIAALAFHFVTVEDFWTVVEMHTTAPAKILGLGDYGLSEGNLADLVVFAARSLDDLLDGDTPRNWVLKRGQVVAQTEITREIHLPAQG